MERKEAQQQWKRVQCALPHQSRLQFPFHLLTDTPSCSAPLRHKGESQRHKSPRAAAPHRRPSLTQLPPGHGDGLTTGEERKQENFRRACACVILPVSVLHTGSGRHELRDILCEQEK
ncbi:hypothetical protein JOB18_036405 [Solea senegalensis]|uniref:Uncharacterized protein n=1 Tax=Solea senegalensis TaxID=28829 RepID=A0AAV6SW38_SOLSE|nr:hypothetical protein JOB18_036405 [Solea senegalensis]